MTVPYRMFSVARQYRSISWTAILQYRPTLGKIELAKTQIVCWLIVGCLWLLANGSYRDPSNLERLWVANGWTTAGTLLTNGSLANGAASGHLLLWANVERELAKVGPTILCYFAIWDCSPPPPTPVLDNIHYLYWPRCFAQFRLGRRIRICVIASLSFHSGLAKWLVFKI